MVDQPLGFDVESSDTIQASIDHLRHEMGVLLNDAYAKLGILGRDLMGEFFLQANSLVDKALDRVSINIRIGKK